ncbi:nose resistant to fluoxetine protein 6-like [Saccoglossus kowalevskii]|uniref:Nose resistant to fluoxetine protein 6-like n=1 Tax=Saccoglossus kowalevskii TaxID=10224 RepID=A0ABM0M0F3_SACKO|nr:PREDICTED: nose resistant to fluoxetine protein 6-like [Saccoglossus kowalevskii]
MATLLYRALVVAVVMPSVYAQLIVMNVVIEQLISAIERKDMTAYERVTPRCLNDTIQFVVDYRYHGNIKTYARQMYFSSGYLPADGEFTMTIKDFGDYDLCHAIKPEVGVNGFGGLYCFSKTDIKPLSTVTADIGVCFPDSCTDQDVPVFVSLVFSTILGRMPISYAPCARKYDLRAGDYVAILICVVLAIVIISGTLYDALRRRCRQNTRLLQTPSPRNYTLESQLLSDEDAVACQSNSDLDIHRRDNPRNCGNKCREFVQGCLLSFSLIEVGHKMMITVHGKSSIACLNGIRVLSMFWIILFHSYLFLAQYYPTIDNYRYVIETMGARWSVIPLWKGDLAVEAFLVLSGLLVSYLTLKQFDRCGGPRHHNWFLFYFHRFWRLTPVYMFVLMMYTTLVLYVSDGPLWWQWYGVQEECRADWWQHLLYINNLIPFPGDTGGCFGWTWYLAVDMQLYVLSPIFIIMFYKSRNGGVCLTTSAICVCLAISAYFATVQGMTFGADTKKYRKPEYDEGAWLYTKPWYRLPNYLVGIVLGYIFFKLNGEKVKINKFLNILLWGCAFAIGLAVVYGVDTSIRGIHISQGAAVFYVTTHRFAFSLAIGWVIFACTTGNGGLVNALLSWTAWLPLARMNYCAYLVHLIVILVYDFSLKSLYYYSTMGFAMDYIGIVVITYGVAYVVAMVVELPMIGLERVIIPSKYKRT